jgi:4-hydroxy-2-oxoheptanedioate aldolase
MRNAVKQAARDGTTIRGVHLTFPAPTLIEVLAAERIDFVYLDGEHGRFSAGDLETACLAAERHGLTAIARVPDRTAAAITGFLDRGLLGIVVPHVDTVGDAREAVAATYFAPLGQRSFGGGRPHYGYGGAGSDRRAHLAECNAGTSLCIMIESASALAAAGEIAALDGVDYLSFGLNDLAQSLGHPGEPDHPEVRAAVARAGADIRAAGKRVREDFMRFAWINDLVLAGARKLLG